MKHDEIIEFAINGETIKAGIDHEHPWPIAEFERERGYVTTTQNGQRYILALDVRSGAYLAHAEAVA